MGNSRVRAEGSDINCTSSYVVYWKSYRPFVTLLWVPKIDEIGCDTELPSQGIGPNVGSGTGGGGFSPGGRSGKKREAHRAAHPSPTKVGVIPSRLTSARREGCGEITRRRCNFCEISPHTNRTGRGNRCRERTY